MLDSIRLLSRLPPFPTLSNPNEGVVHAGQEEDQFEHQHHRRHNQTEHVAWGGIPFVGSGPKKFIPAINVAMCRAYEESQIPQLRLKDKRIALL